MEKSKRGKLLRNRKGTECKSEIKKVKKKGMEIFHAEFKIRKHGFCIDMMQT